MTQPAPTPILLRGGRVVDPSRDLDATLDLRLEDGRVAELGEGLEARGAAERDVSGLVVVPGLIDAHARFGEPGFEYRETLRSGLLAAAAGGYTGVACLAGTRPVHDGRSVTEHLLAEAARHPYARLHPIGALSRGRDGEELAELGEMRRAGAVAFSDADRPTSSGALLRRALFHVRHYDALVIDRPEDVELADSGMMHEGGESTRLGLPGRPAVAEEIAVARDLLLAEETGGRLCLALVSTAGAIERVRAAKAAGLGVVCTAAVHHAVLDHREVGRSGFSTAVKVLPPLRAPEDVAALVAALADGTIDALVSDHAAFHNDEKDVQFSEAPFGIVGLETTVSLCLDRLVRPGHLSLPRLVELLSRGPARLLGLDGGSLAPGSPADITLLDLERQVTVDPTTFRSLGRSTPFAGHTLRGAAVGTLVGGRMIDLP